LWRIAIFRLKPEATRPALVLLALVVAVTTGAFWIRTHRGDHQESVASTADPPVNYVGAASCRECHEPEYRAWETSDHSQAMQPAEPGHVLGNFDGAHFTYANVTSTFFRRDGRFWVRTDGADGALQDFEVKYAFGVSPLQQYLIELAGGRMQALSIAWDTRPKPAGGQRWFHLYPGEAIDHQDELHWTGRQQNWNFMCADCHSTNVHKGYDATADRYRTRWSDINVACEACHGPGSRHVTWARTSPASRRGDNGLTIHFFERRGVRWTPDPGTLRPRRSAPRTTSTEIDVCAQCHSRREQIAEGYTAGAPLEDYYVPELIMPGLYYADGQQRDEVYTYGSFLQSRMAHQGVTCADCHEPHSQQLRAPGNLLCAQCHAPAHYDSAAHHFHKPQSAGAQCVSCHMPPRTYMVIDARRDHSFRIPRPDRSVHMGVPNACNACHQDRGARWADEQIRIRTDRSPAGFQTFAEVFDAADSNDPASTNGLRRIADDLAQPAIVRASALARLASTPAPVALDAATRHLADPDPSVRRAALMVFETVPPEARRALVAPLLSERVRSVRLQAAWVLAPASGGITGTADERAFTRAAGELIASRRYRADRPEDRTTLGVFLAQLGRRDEAIAEYRAALHLSPRYTPAYVNLSDLQRQQGTERQAEQTLRDGLAVMPQDAMLHHALGLSLARSGRHADAVQELKRAANLSSDARFTYAYAVALHSAGRVKEAIDTLERARARNPNDREVLVALATFHRDAGAIIKALEYAEQLSRVYPDDVEARALVTSLRSSRPPDHPQ
jgi:tetratricopeptide (TPR) repeat protein